MESNEICRGSPFYNAVIKELSLIVETENIVDQINPILSLEIKLNYIIWHRVSEVQQINSERSWFVALHLHDAQMLCIII